MLMTNQQVGRACLCALRVHKDVLILLALHPLPRDTCPGTSLGASPTPGCGLSG